MADQDRAVLVCSAWEPEQRVLRHVFGVPTAEPPTQAELERFGHLLPGALVQSGLSGDSGVRFALLDVGSLAAGVSLARILSEAVAQGRDLPQLVCFVGTAGASRSAPPVRGLSLPFVASVSRVSWHDTDVASGMSYLTQPQKEQLILVSGREFANADDLHGPCLSTWGITRVESDTVPRDGWLENLELYGLALVCRQFGVPWQAWLGVSNWIGAKAHEEWKRHNIEASVLAQATLYAAVLGGGSSSNP